MRYCLTVYYTADNAEDIPLEEETVHTSIMRMLNTVLPYMVDNVTMHFDYEEE